MSRFRFILNKKYGKQSNIVQENLTNSSKKEKLWLSENYNDLELQGCSIITDLYKSFI